MALINCSECGKEISDKAVACPHCGAPVEKVFDETDAQKNETSEPLEEISEEELNRIAELAKIERRAEIERERVELDKRLKESSKTMGITGLAILLIIMLVSISFYSCSGSNEAAITEEVAPAIETDSRWREVDAKGSAETAIKSILKDPESATFSSVTYNSSYDCVCGYVNAKNALGGYTGKTRFMVVNQNAVMEEQAQSEQEHKQFNEAWTKVCESM
jgi:hypothetical protein